MLRNSLLLGIFAFACLLACGSSIERWRQVSGGNPPGHGPVSETTLTNEAVMQRLASTCQGCHRAGSNLPFFGSLNSFENLLVYNTRYVIPGNPDGSELIRLLSGNGTGTYRQMPINGPSFAALADQNQTNIKINELKLWVRALTLPTTRTSAPLTAGTVRRLSAEQVLTSLYDQLGLSDSDFFYGGYAGIISEDRYPARSPDMIPAIPGAYGAYLRFDALGGPNWLDVRKRSLEFSPAFLQTIVQMSQAWCRIAIRKPGNTAFFKEASPSDTSDQAPDAIKANIAYLYLRMLGEEASADEVRDLFSNVFVPFERDSGTEAAWVSVCSTLIRDPIWLSY